MKKNEIKKLSKDEILKNLELFMKKNDERLTD